MISTLLSLVLVTVQPVSVRVDGEGYLRFIRDGRIVYASAAELSVQGGLLGSKGLPLTPAIKIPENVAHIDIDLSGDIIANKATCGRIVLARFTSKLVENSGFLISSSR